MKYLARELRRLAEVRVRYFGGLRDEAGVFPYPVPDGLAAANPALQALVMDLEMAAACAGADVVHTHTWYANLAGHLAKLLHGTPHVVTTHRLPVREVIQLLTHATVFVCPSVYEPMGIVNLEAMACQTPVVATATGGIPEVVADGVSGLLVPVEQQPDGEPRDQEKFAAALAERITTLLGDAATAAMGRAGRARAVGCFSWERVAEQTRALYEELR